MRTFLFVTLLIFFLGGVVFVAMLIYSPKKTTVSDLQKQAAFKKLLGRDPMLTEAIRSTGVLQYDGKYITFSYPTAAQNYSYDDANMKNSTSVLENKEFKESSPRYHFIVQVIKQSNDVRTYDDVPSIRLRRTQTDTYRESPISIGKESALAFVDQADGYEKDAFLLRGGLLYTFVITGGNPDIETIFNNVISSVKFK